MLTAPLYTNEVGRISFSFSPSSFAVFIPAADTAFRIISNGNKDLDECFILCLTNCPSVLLAGWLFLGLELHIRVLFL